MIGSHNSMTYLSPKNLWGMITIPWSKCQSKTLQEQYDAGVRFFDIRVCKIKEAWHYVHNKVDYGKVDLQALTDFFKSHADIYLRIVYDLRSTPADAEERRKSFYKEVVFPILTNAWVRITYITFWEWKIEYTHSSSVIEMEYHASVSAKWYQYILGTKWFARHHNERIKELYADTVKSEDIAVLIDFV